MKFLCDAMLGKLARWLRIMGYDTLLARDETDSDLLSMASAESRVLLTLDSRLSGDNVEHLPDKLPDQLVFLASIGMIDIPSEPVPRVCPVCNGELVPTTENLPQNVQSGWVCKRCGKVYWEGSHWRRMREFLAEVRRRVEQGSQKSS